MTDEIDLLEAIQKSHLQTKRLASIALDKITKSQQLVAELELNSFNSESIASFSSQIKQTLVDDLAEEFKAGQDEMQQWGRLLEKVFLFF